MKKKKKGIKNQTYNTYIYKIIFIFFTFIFSIIFFNKFLKQTEHYKFLQIIIYIGLIFIFSYFSLKLISSKEVNFSKIEFLLLGIGFMLIVSIYILAFDPHIDMGGDSAFYIIGAKSFAEGKGYRLLYLPGEPKNTWGPPALSFILAPIVYFLDIKIVPFKRVIFFFSILIFLITFLFLKKKLSPLIAIILTMIIITNSHIIHFSSLILTEIPYLFFSILSLFLLTKYEEKVNFINKYLFLSAIFMVVTALTREVGVGFLVSSVLYFIIKKQYKKAFALGIMNLILYLPWKIRCAGGISHTSRILATQKGSFIEKITYNVLVGLRNLPNIIPQNIFNYRIAAWEILNINTWIIIVFIIIIIGYFYNTIKKLSQMDLYILFVLTPIICIRPNAPIEFARFTMIFIPFLIYYFYNGLNLCIKYFGLKKQPNLTNTIVLIILSIILFCNLLGASDRIEYAHRKEPYLPPYENFLKTAIWAKNNTPKNVIFATRKPRIFYLFSERYCLDYAGFDAGSGVSVYDVWSKENEEKILKVYKEKNVDYLVLDRFSSSAYNLILPIIRNNMNKFEVVYVTPEPATYVFKIKK